MRYMRRAAMVGVLLAGFGMMAAPADARGHLGFGVGLGVGVASEPVCAFGYYPYEPYACAPYGYYGPDWFAGGVFIGAGPFVEGRGVVRGVIPRGAAGRLRR